MTDESLPIYLEGHISVRAALTGGLRTVNHVYLLTGRIDPDTARVEELAEKNGVRLSRVSSGELALLTGNPKATLVAALVGPRGYLTGQELSDAAGSGWLAALDGVEDPYNFGGALRALYAAGASGILVGPRNWYTTAAVIAKSSAGASELMPSAIFESPTSLIDLARSSSRRLIVAAETEDSQSLYDTDLTSPCIVVIGGERRGAARELLKSADTIIRIPYGRSGFASLGTIAAASAIAFEILRQRGTDVKPSPRPSASPPRTRSRRRPSPGF